MSYFTRNMDKCSRLHFFPVTRYSVRVFFSEKKVSTSFLPHLQPVFGKSLSFLYIFCCVLGPNAIEARRRKLTASLILNMNNEYRTIQGLMKIYLHANLWFCQTYTVQYVLLRHARAQMCFRTFVQFQFAFSRQIIHTTNQEFRNKHGTKSCRYTTYAA